MLVKLLPWLLAAMKLVWSKTGFGVRVPSSLLRNITFKLARDVQQIPALKSLTAAGLRLLTSGDSSEWDQAMQMPHYNSNDMPCISSETALHLIQVTVILLTTRCS